MVMVMVMVMVRFVSPDGIELPPVPALMDTGADRTIIPSAIAEGLQLRKGREVELGGIGGTTIVMASYYVTIRIHDLPPIECEVFATLGERHALLGRDVLNHFRVLLDGPRGVLEIE
ncbi:MAG: retropepsin-like aspartic protease [Pirellulales bacterium]